jgi:hypothetical protein
VRTGAWYVLPGRYHAADRLSGIRRAADRLSFATAFDTHFCVAGIVSHGFMESDSAVGYGAISATLLGHNIDPVDQNGDTRVVAISELSSSGILGQENVAVTSSRDETCVCLE